MVDRGKNSVKDMINSAVFVRFFNGDNILRRRNDADNGLIPLLVSADRADISVRQVLTDRTEVNNFSRVIDRSQKLFRLSVGHAKNMKSDALRRFFADTGKFSELLGQHVERVDIIRHIRNRDRGY